MKTPQAQIGVKQRRFLRPRFLQRAHSASYAAVFGALWTMSDGDGVLDLDADRIATATGYSRKTVYKAIRWFREVRITKRHCPVLEIVEARRGRGKHSLARLNWKRFAPRADQSPRYQTSAQKCHPPYPYREQRQYSPPSGDEQVVPANRNAWTSVMRGFRNLLQSTDLNPSECRAVVGTIGRYLKGRTVTTARRIWTRFHAWLDRRGWRIMRLGASVRELCSQMIALIKALLRPKQPRRGQDASEADDHIWAQVRREKAAVSERRGDAGAWREQPTDLWRYAAYGTGDRGTVVDRTESAPFSIRNEPDFEEADGINQPKAAGESYPKRTGALSHSVQEFVQKLRTELIKQGLDAEEIEWQVQQTTQLLMQC